MATPDPPPSSVADCSVAPLATAPGSVSVIVGAVLSTRRVTVALPVLPALSVVVARMS